ncbi:MAG: serpin family protein, partial [Candidatus Ornithomonoglobus sp.]
EGLIPQFLSGNISDNVQLAIFDTLYMNAEWENYFDPDKTYKQSFYVDEKTEAETSFMHRTSDYKCISNDEYNVLFISYADNKYVFAAIMPKNTDIKTFAEKNLNSGFIVESYKASDMERAAVSLPAFSTECSTDLRTYVENMGLKSIFDPEQSDFSKMLENSEDSICVGMFSQKVKINVHEKGTEAAAATGMMMAGSALAEEPIEMCFDKPFAYAVVNTENASILFAGIMSNPVE